MNITTTKLTDIKSNPNNPRIIKDDKFKKLVESIKEFPQMLSLRPIVVNDNMIVLGGNMRLKACKEAGLKEVPIIKASDLNQEQQKAFIIKDNVGYGEWDWDMLANEWDAEELVEWGLDVPVFNVDDLGTADEKDLSDKIQSQFRIEVICIDEESQENTYNNLIEQGYECRLLTL
jgi:ParB-like chromosome segregation protein Spo0J